MVVGLYCYTFTLTGSLPGLRHWQALIVNVAGSSVGNLLPGGGAAGLAATYTICRSWGFSRRDISTSAIVTGVWNVLSRIALPLVAILALLAGRDEDVPRALEDAAIAGAVTGGILLAVFVAVLASERAAVAIGQGIDRVIGRLWQPPLDERPVAGRRPALADQRRRAHRLAQDDPRPGRVLRRLLPALPRLHVHDGRGPALRPAVRGIRHRPAAHRRRGDARAGSG